VIESDRFLELTKTVPGMLYCLPDSFRLEVTVSAIMPFKWSVEAKGEPDESESRFVD
jgi:hypothetical protein